MTRSSTMVFVMLLLLVGGVFLQIFLSRMKSKWFGLILPAITLLYSFLMVLSLAVFDGMRGVEVFMLIASTFILNNIPTIVLLGIYFGCREKMKVHSQLDKMSIQDLD